MREHLRRPVFVLVMSAIMVGVMVAPAGAAPKAETVHVSGVGYPGGPSPTADCPLDNGADYTIYLPGDEGDLDGCIYGYFTEKAKELDNGIVNTWDDEVFVGDFGGLSGSWEMDEHFTAKFPDGQKFGRCQHAIVKGSGEGDFEGITGRLDFKDDVVLGTADYRGHLKIPNGA